MSEGHLGLAGPTAAGQSAHDVADRLLARHAARFGVDRARYEGHVHRVIALVDRQLPLTDAEAQLLGVAAFAHDAGIWFAQTWDYLGPSVDVALAELPEDATAEQRALVTAMVEEHHRLTRAHHPHPLVEALRRADLHDLTAGLRPAPGVGRPWWRAIRLRHPSLGFRRMLVRAFVSGVRAEPTRPLPMLKR